MFPEETLGIDYRGTQYNKAEGKMNLLVSYHVDPMFNWFGLSPVCVRQGIVTRAWIGGEDHSEHSDPDSSEKEIVYVAENGVVYHRSRDCAYIDIELNVAAAYEISQIRNEQEQNIIRVSCVVRPVAHIIRSILRIQVIATTAVQTAAALKERSMKWF